MTKYYIDLHKSSWGQWRASAFKPGSFMPCIDSKFCYTKLEALADVTIKLPKSEKECVEFVISERRISD